MEKWEALSLGQILHGRSLFLEQIENVSIFSSVLRVRIVGSPLIHESDLLLAPLLNKASQVRGKNQKPFRLARLLKDTLMNSNSF